MKFILFVEGYTEEKALPDFLKRWLNPQLKQRVGIQAVCLDGWRNFVKDVSDKARRYLTQPQYADDVIAVIGLLDLYGPTFYPNNKTDVNDRYTWAKRHLEHEVGQERYRQFFAVHEIEAWLLSAPDIFPNQVRTAFPGTVSRPETVDFDMPPKKMLQRLYRERIKEGYKEVVHGAELFGKLSPDVVYDKCPYFREMLDEMLKLALAAEE